MLRLTSVPIPLTAADADIHADVDIHAAAAAFLAIPVGRVRACRLIRRAVDARRKDAVRLVLTLDVALDGDEAAALAACPHPSQTSLTLAAAPARMPTQIPPPVRRPVIVGAGPAGLFAALTLAQAGARPILLERGKDVERRRADVDRFFTEGILDEASNIQFGEGGAGTFSDGKLTTGISDSRRDTVLHALVQAGAPEEILWQAKPHIGTDNLRRIVRALRASIESFGGSVHFDARVNRLQIEHGAVRGVTVGDEQLDTDCVVLAIGHSARDTFEALLDSGVAMIRKPFSIGVRIEHPQQAIDGAQYGRLAGHPALGASEYKLSAHLRNGRGVYTFCMCPGGVVVAAASEAGGVVTNGMSDFRRDGVNANAALLVDVRPDDFDDDDGPLAGIAFQRRWERLAFTAGGSDYRAPTQRVEDFLAGRTSKRLGAVRASYRPGVTPADLRACLPAFVVESLCEALPRFDRQLCGFAAADALLTGVETRSSCPVRIPRGETGEANIAGLFPAGEGAGYAGGILSAAVDGIRAAEAVIQKLLVS